MKNLEKLKKDDTFQNQFFLNSIGGNGTTFLDPLLSPREAARYLSVSEKFIYEHTARGDIPVQPVGRLIRIRKSDLETWLTNQRR
jgi:excisionase family DNA binding protein